MPPGVRAGVIEAMAAGITMLVDCRVFSTVVIRMQRKISCQSSRFEGILGHNGEPEIVRGGGGG
eukprot:COSAG01_NODE_26913_length_699_cov_2.370000_1_plen_63_part_10